MPSVRNDYLHFRRDSPDSHRIEEALEAIRQAVTKIETLGFCLLLYRPGTTVRDEWGQAGRVARPPGSYRHQYVRPSRFDWMGMPDVRQPLYLVRAATVGEPTEALRFTRRFTSPYSEYWSNYPRRRKKSKPTSGVNQSQGMEFEATPPA